jgi:hypothetical protein
LTFPLALNLTSNDEQIILEVERTAIATSKALQLSA